MRGASVEDTTRQEKKMGLASATVSASSHLYLLMNWLAVDTSIRSLSLLSTYLRVKATPEG